MLESMTGINEKSNSNHVLFQHHIYRIVTNFAGWLLTAVVAFLQEMPGIELPTLGLADNTLYYWASDTTRDSLCYIIISFLPTDYNSKAEIPIEGNQRRKWNSWEI